ncbi:MAG: DUF3047 domain-containing protein [Chrysiogenetes bacterium]|nr:DUF3047 domain-containing protein [Chrysiogenetes bacterium]
MPALALLFLSLAPAAAQQPLLSLPLSSKPAEGAARLKPLHFPKIDAHTSYTLSPEGLRAVANASASGLIAPFRTEVCPGVRLSWRWKIERAPTGSGAPGKDGDDYAARMAAVFDYDPELYKWWERLARILLSKEYKELVPGAALEYVWSPAREPGARWDNPYTDKAKMIAVEGAAGEWSAHEADLCADYRKAFGREPPELVGIFLMSDADNSQSAARAVYGDVGVTRK